MKIKTAITVLILALFCHRAYPAQLGHKPPIKSTNGTYKFSGKMNNSLPVFIWFVVKDDVLKGEVTYLKTPGRIPITIIGTITKTGGASITEFSKTASITGFYHGKFNQHSFSGIWNAPGSGKQLKFNLTKKDTVAGNSPIDLKPTIITGAYTYQYDKLGAAGRIDIQETKPGYFTFRINCVTESPANNVADTQGVNVKMVSNTITHQLPDQDCKFFIEAYNGFMIISHAQTRYDCGFGNGADIDGIFLKTSDKARVDLL